MSLSRIMGYHLFQMIVTLLLEEVLLNKIVFTVQFVWMKCCCSIGA